MMPQWTTHLKDPEETKRFKAYIQGSRTILDRQLEIVEGWERDLNSKELDEDRYESPSWAARQADINGERRAYRKMKQLLTLDQKDK